MFASLIMLGLWLAAGFAVTQLLPLRISRSERLAVSAVLGIVIGAWTSFAAVFILDWQIGLVVAALCCLIITLVVWRHPRWQVLQIEPVDISPRMWIYRSLLVAVAVYLLDLLFHHTLSPSSQGGWLSGGYTWADMALHMTLMSHFAYQPHMTMVFSIFPQSSVSYPFMVDFASAVLLRLGAGWRPAILLISVPLLLSFLQLSILAVKTLLKSALAAYLHLFLFLTMGSTAGVLLYIKEVQGGRGWWDAVLQNDYSNYGNTERLHLANIVNSHLLPQRSYLFGIAVAMVILVLFRQIYEKARDRRRLAIAAGVLLGLLPLIHVHSFFLLSGFLVLLGLGESIARRRVRSVWLLVMAVALPIAAPQVVWQFQMNYSSSFAHSITAWMAEGQNPALFWVRNAGLLLPFLVLQPLLFALVKHDRFLALLGVLGLGTFMVCNVHAFQPNEWDNMKFLTYALWTSLLSLVMVLSLIRSRPLKMGAAIVTMLCISTPGVLTLARERTLDYQFETAQDISFAQKVRETIPVDARVLTTDTHNNPVPVLTGREIVQGYGGWLWSYGISYQGVAADVKIMLRGGTDTELLLRKYKVTHIVFSQNEVWAGEASLTYYQNHHHLLYAGEGWYIFTVEK